MRHAPIITCSSWNSRLARLAKRADVEVSGQALRLSYAAYRLAQVGNPDQVSAELGISYGTRASWLSVIPPMPRSAAEALIRRFRISRGSMGFLEDDSMKTSFHGTTLDQEANRSPLFRDHLLHR
jgi:hypothetical protein